MTATKRITRLGAIFLLVITMISILAPSALAASTTTKPKTTYGTTRGQSSAYIYVKTGSTAASRKVTLNMTKGTMKYSHLGQYTESSSVYGAYEIKVSYWNGSKWVAEKNYDVYNKPSNKVPLAKKNTYYRIQIYSWNVNTVFKSYGKNDIIPDVHIPLLHIYVSQYENIYWSKIPTCTAKPGRGCTMYSSNPKA